MKTRKYKTKKLIPDNLALFPGITIILVSLLYMIVNLDRVDSFVNLWVIFMILGIALTACGLIINLKNIRKSK